MVRARAAAIGPRRRGSAAQAHYARYAQGRARGLDYLARSQGSDGAWGGDQGGRAYPVAITSLAGMAMLAHGNTPTRGKYAPQIKAAVDYLIKCSQPSGLITSPSQDSGQPMHGHGFALTFLATVYGMETKESNARPDQGSRAERSHADGPWTERRGRLDIRPRPGRRRLGDRHAGARSARANNAGFNVPRGTIEQAVRYLERCRTPDGGICYSLGSGGGARLAISAAAVATLYNAGEYDAPIAEQCLEYVWQNFKSHDGWSKGGGHDFYCQFYASQGFYMSGDKYWDEYFPGTRDALLKSQDKAEGSWNGDYIGKAYGTAIAVMILQLPYKYLPVFQR